MIKARAELSPENVKPVFEWLYGRKKRIDIIVNIILVIWMTILFIALGMLILYVVMQGYFGKLMPISMMLLLLSIVCILFAVNAAIRMMMSVKNLAQGRSMVRQITGTAEFEFGEEGFFSKVEREGFLSERFSVYSTIDSAMEYKGYFIVQSKGVVGAFAVSDIFEGDADKLRELLSAKIGKRFRVIKW